MTETQITTPTNPGRPDVNQPVSIREKGDLSNPNDAQQAVNLGEKQANEKPGIGHTAPDMSLEVLPFSPDNVDGEGVLIRVVGGNRSAFANNAGQTLAIQVRGEHHFVGNAAIDSGYSGNSVRPVDAETLKPIPHPVDGCKWMQEIRLVPAI